MQPSEPILTIQPSRAHPGPPTNKPPWFTTFVEPLGDAVPFDSHDAADPSAKSSSTPDDDHGDGRDHDDSHDDWHADEEDNLPVAFRLGPRLFSARAVTRLKTNVLRLHLDRSPLESLASRLLQHLTHSLQVWLTSKWPALFLPPTVILKRQKPRWQEEFDRELAAYELLQPLQGSVIPRLYAEVTCYQGDAQRRAMLLSDVGDTTLANSLAMDENCLADMVHNAHRSIAEFGLFQYESFKLDHCHLFHNKIVIVDLESIDTTDDTPEDTARSITNHLMRHWREKCSEHITTR